MNNPNQRKKILMVQRGFAAISMAMIFGFMASPQASADSTNQLPVSVAGDDSINGYQGNGGLLLPQTFSGPARTRMKVANCLDCIWRYTIYCDATSTSMCAHAVVTCPAGKIRFRVWFGKTVDELTVVGSVCWGSSRPATRREFESQVKQSALRLLPQQQPGISPRLETLVSVPVSVWSGQSQTVRPKPMSLSGHNVQIIAKATWLWQWGDGTRNWTGLPGGRYPKSGISHKFSKPGNYSLRLTTVWQAEYFMAGLGSFQVSGDVIHQEKALKILVKSARSVLVAR